MITGGTDMRLRYWDMHNVDASAIMVHAASDPQHTAVKYRYTGLFI